MLDLFIKNNLTVNIVVAPSLPVVKVQKIPPVMHRLSRYQMQNFPNMPTSSGPCLNILKIKYEELRRINST